MRNNFLNKFTQDKNNLYFCGFIILHIILWTILPMISRFNPYMDTLEAIIWGQEWQWGYHKHPPLSAWVAQLMMDIFHKKVWATYLLSQLCVASSMIAIWRLAKIFLNARTALLAVFLVEGIYYYNFTSAEFNTNILILALWSWIIFYSWKACKTNKICYWLIFGVLVALGLLTKYYTLILVTSIALMMLYEPQFRKYLKTPNPYLSLLPFLIIFGPHILWLFDNNFTTIHYLSQRSQNIYKIYNHLLSPLCFTLTQIFSLSFALLIFFFAFGRNLKISDFKLRDKNILDKNPDKKFPDKKAVFLIFMFLAPFILTIAPSLLTASRIRDMWGTPLWGMTGILLFYFLRPQINDATQKRFFQAWVMVVIIAATAFMLTNIITLKPQKRNSFNGELTAKIITEGWHKYSKKPLEIVAGDIWLASNISFFSPNRPKVFIDLDENISPWLTYQTFENKGGIVIWNAFAEGKNLPEKFKDKINSAILIQQPLLIQPNSLIDIQSPQPFEIGWAIILPKDNPSYFSWK